MAYYNDEWSVYREINEEEVIPIYEEYFDLLIDGYFNDEDTEDEMMELLRDDYLPKQKEIIEFLENIHVQEKQVKEFHELYLDVERFQYEKFAELLEVFFHEKNEEQEKLLEEKSDELAKGMPNRKENIEKQKEKLLKKYDLEIVKEYFEQGGHRYRMVEAEEQTLSITFPLKIGTDLSCLVSSKVPYIDIRLKMDFQLSRRDK